MMIMRRREGEKILIGDSIVVHITQIGRNKVKIGIEAPRELTIVAEEIQRVADENAAALRAQPSGILPLLKHLQARA
jgi:carbon storage regulator